MRSKTSVRIAAAAFVAGVSLSIAAGSASANGPEYVPPGYSEACPLGVVYVPVGTAPLYEADGKTPVLNDFGVQVLNPVFGWVCKAEPAELNTDTKPAPADNKTLNEVEQSGSGNGAYKDSKYKTH